jgi:hypothetical protein
MFALPDLVTLKHGAHLKRSRLLLRLVMNHKLPKPDLSNKSLHVLSELLYNIFILLTYQRLGHLLFHAVPDFLQSQQVSTLDTGPSLVQGAHESPMESLKVNQPSTIQVAEPAPPCLQIEDLVVQVLPLSLHEPRAAVFAHRELERPAVNVGIKRLACNGFQESFKEPMLGIELVAFALFARGYRKPFSFRGDGCCLVTVFVISDHNHFARCEVGDYPARCSKQMIGWSVACLLTRQGSTLPAPFKEVEVVLILGSIGFDPARRTLLIYATRFSTERYLPTSDPLG